VRVFLCETKPEEKAKGSVMSGAVLYCSGRHFLSRAGAQLRVFFILETSLLRWYICILGNVHCRDASGKPSSGERRKYILEESIYFFWDMPSIRQDGAKTQSLQLLRDILSRVPLTHMATGVKCMASEERS
jgi:hypothetical protein